MSSVNRWIVVDDTNGVSPKGFKGPGDSATVMRMVSDHMGRLSQGAAASNLKLALNPVYATALVSGSNPANNDTINLGNVIVTFVTGTPSGNQVKIGTDVNATMANLVAFINSSASLAGIITASIVAGVGTLPAGGVNLGFASTYAVIASSTITAAGTTTVIGDLALSPGSSVTGFPPSTVSGTQHVADAAAAAAQVAALAAYNDMSSRSITGTIVGDISTASPISAGVYATTGGLTGAVTLTGSATDVWIFKCASTLITAASSSIILTGGALAKNVFWRVASSATLGASSSILGTIIAQASISVGSGATSGDLFALTGAVTFAGTGNTASVNNGSAGAPTAASTLLSSAIPGTIGNGLELEASALTVGAFVGGSEGTSQVFELGK